MKDSIVAKKLNHLLAIRIGILPRYRKGKLPCQMAHHEIIHLHSIVILEERFHRRMKTKMVASSMSVFKLFFFLQID